MELSVGQGRSLEGRGGAAPSENSLRAHAPPVLATGVLVQSDWVSVNAEIQSVANT